MQGSRGWRAWQRAAAAAGRRGVQGAAVSREPAPAEAARRALPAVPCVALHGGRRGQARAPPLSPYACLHTSPPSAGAARRRLSGLPADPGEELPGALEQAMQKLLDGKELLSQGEPERAGLLLEEAIGALHGGLGEEAFAGATRGPRGGSEWAVMPQTVTREVLAEARFLAGTAAQKLGRWERALSHFQSAMRDCPGVVATVPAFFYGTATSQAVLGDLDAALSNFRTYESAIKKGNFVPNTVQRMMLSFNIGQTLVRMQRDEEARQAFQDVFARSGSSKGEAAPESKSAGPLEEKERRAIVAAAHYWTAVSAGALGKPKEAVAHLEAFESAAAEGSCDGTLLEQGWEERYRARLIKALLQSDAEKNMDTAVGHAKILCAIAPDQPAYRRVLAECLFNSNDLQGAAEAFRFLLTMPHSPAQHDVTVLLNYARCLHDLGDLEGSHTYFSHVLAQEPSHADAVLGLAAVGIAKLRQGSVTQSGTGSSGTGSTLAMASAGPAPLSSEAGVDKDHVSLRTPREEWMEGQLASAAGDRVSPSVQPSSSLELAEQVSAALSKLRRLLKNRSGAQCCQSHVVPLLLVMLAAKANACRILRCFCHRGACRGAGPGSRTHRAGVRF